MKSITENLPIMFSLQLSNIEKALKEYGEASLLHGRRSNCSNTIEIINLIKDKTDKYVSVLNAVEELASHLLTNKEQEV